jgi:hypothetical protein
MDIYNSFEFNPYYLIIIELHYLYQYFGYPLAKKLYKILERSGYEINKQNINYLIKFYIFY